MENIVGIAVIGVALLYVHRLGKQQGSRGGFRAGWRRGRANRKRQS